MAKYLVTGAAGFIGRSIAAALLARGETVRGVDNFSTGKRENLVGLEAMEFLGGDLADPAACAEACAGVEIVFHEAALASVPRSVMDPVATNVNCVDATLNLLVAARGAGVRRVVYAGSSSAYGDTPTLPKHEEMLPNPISPYAVAKVAAHWYGVNYREAYGLFISNGILFNHESERRGETFVTRKITRALGRIKLGLIDKFYLGNLESRRDWGYAGDYVEAMWLMLQQAAPDDYVVATGEAHSVKEFLDLAAESASVDWTKCVGTDPRYFRPTEVDSLCGDSSKARAKLGWKPKVSFPELVRKMVDHDMEQARRERTLLAAGHAVHI